MWFKFFRQKKLQSCMIMIIVMVCAILLSGSMGILLSIEKPISELVEECKPPATKIYPVDLKPETAESLLAEIKELPMVDFAKISYQYSVENKLFYKDKQVNGFNNLTIYDEDIHKDRYRFISEKVSKPKEGECFIQAAFSNKYGIQVGDTITIKEIKQTYKYMVKAIVCNPYNMSLAFNSEILVSNLPANVNASLPILVFSKEGFTGSDVEEAYREAHDGMFYGRSVNLTEVITMSRLTGKILGGVLFASGFIILLVSVLIIRFMIKNAILSDTKTIAVYKTIGYSTKDILMLYMKFYFLLVSVGAFIGILGSSVISESFLSSLFENIGEVRGASMLIPGIICYGLILSIVTFSIFLVLIQIRKNKPVASLTGNEVSLLVGKRVTSKWIRKMSFSSFGIALRMIYDDKKNTIGILLTCMMAVFGVNFAGTALNEANGMQSNNYYWTGIDKCEMMIEVEDKEEVEQIYETILQDENVEKVYKNVYDVAVSIKWKKGMQLADLPGFVYEDYTGLSTSLVEGRNPVYANEIVLTSLVAKNLGKEVGDYISISLDKKVFQDYLITGLFQAYYNGGNAARLLGSAFDRSQVEMYNQLSVYLKDASQLDNMIEKYEDLYGTKANVIKRVDKYLDVMEMIAVPQQRALPPFLILIMMIGAINIFYIVLLKTINNRKNHTIYKCIGYSSWHLFKANLVYVATLAIITISSTIPVFIVLYPKIMVLCLSMFGFKEYPTSYNSAMLCVINLSLFMVFIISGVLASKSIFKSNARELIKE